MELLGWTVAGTLGHVAGLLLFLEAGGTFKASVHLREAPVKYVCTMFRVDSTDRLGEMQIRGRGVRNPKNWGL